MELELTAEEQAFRSEVRAFLASELTPELRQAAATATSVFVDRDVSLEWQRRLHTRGWVAPAWPVEYGGTGWTPVQRYIFEYELAAANAPPLSPLGLNMCAHVIIRFGTEAQKRFYLPRMLSGEDYWCQGYSEPGAGSDLASLKCRAEADGDDYIVTGTKIWTTHAQFANHMFCLVRTSGEGKPQAGITFLLIDMHSPGITVRPIFSLGGDHEINQVFFDGVRVPKANRIAEEGQGWTCAKYLLEFERGAAVLAPRLRTVLQHLKNVAKREADGRGGSLAQEQWVRRRLAELEVDLLSLEFMELDALRAAQRGATPGAEASILKTEVSELQQRLSEFAMDLVGPLAVLFDRRRPLERDERSVGPEYAALAAPRYFNQRAASIYAGTNEIQRSLIARNVLGL
jgi:alkylation response protein AidB-like acyl-CoA dehydrogenase